MIEAKTYAGDCLKGLLEMERESADLVYVDPPFFSQKEYKSVAPDGTTSFAFRDIWDSEDAYADYIYRRIVCARYVLKSTGSLFFHCDKSASHIIRLMLDRVFGPENFRSEIIWTFKRWSNAKKGLLPAHQTIFFYSKTHGFKFNTFYQEYSPATNIDQIMQRRVRDSRNKTVYQRNDSGDVVGNGAKKGVPLSDVWDIPFLNPKAKERVGFPTQKPVLLMKRLIKLVTDVGDWVLDPFCGSGTTLIASRLLGRNSIGMDISEEAIELAKRRLEVPVSTKSLLLEKGRESYRQHQAIAAGHLFDIDYTPIHRNGGIDGLLKREVNGLPVFIRVQRREESLVQSVAALKKAARNKGDCGLVVVATHTDLLAYESPPDVDIIPSTALALNQYTSSNKSAPIGKRELCSPRN